MAESESDIEVSEDPSLGENEDECTGSGLDLLADAGMEPAELAEILEALTADDDAINQRLSALDACSFLAPGGDWGGSRAPCERAAHVGRTNGLTVTGRKRTWGSTGSDHHVSQRNSYAVDMSNGRSPTPQMHRTAQQIAAALGRPGWRGGILNVVCARHRMRGQLIWNTTGHYDHVHFGARRT
jgi:hypothetical protein